MPFSFAYIWWYDPRRNEDFHGDDVVALNASSRNGVRRTQFPTFVEPINDPSVILAPSSILLSGNESWEGYRIFDKNRDTFEFSIVDPDLHNFPGIHINSSIDRSWCCLIMHCLKEKKKKINRREEVLLFPSSLARSPGGNANRDLAVQRHCRGVDEDRSR